MGGKSTNSCHFVNCLSSSESMNVKPMLIGPEIDGRNIPIKLRGFCGGISAFSKVKRLQYAQ